VTPFGINLRSHRLPGPLSLRSAAYALDFDYVKAIGAVDSTLRTEEQSQILLASVKQDRELQVVTGTA